VNKLRTSFVQSGLSEIEIDIGGRKIKFFVLPASLNKGLPDFALAVVTDDRSHYVFGVSESVPEPFRKYWAFHEHVEYLEELEGPDRCVRTLEQELRLVPEDLKPEYLRRRLAFFRSLADYALSKPEDFTPEQIQKYGKSLSKLEELTSMAK